eukprot:scaffold16938_cov18-Tisochrysis_lutea.AAC.1
MKRVQEAVWGEMIGLGSSIPRESWAGGVHGGFLSHVSGGLGTDSMLGAGETGGDAGDVGVAGQGEGVVGGMGAVGGVGSMEGANTLDAPSFDEAGGSLVPGMPEEAAYGVAAQPGVARSPPDDGPASQHGVSGLPPDDGPATLQDASLPGVAEPPHADPVTVPQDASQLGVAGQPQNAAQQPPGSGRREDDDPGSALPDAATQPDFVQLLQSTAQSDPADVASGEVEEAQGVGAALPEVLVSAEEWRQLNLGLQAAGFSILPLQTAPVRGAAGRAAVPGLWCCLAVVCAHIAVGCSVHLLLMRGTHEHGHKHGH